MPRPRARRVEAYTDIRTSLEGLSGKINGLYGELDWMPIHYIHRSAPRKRLTKIYRSSRIGLFTPLRDGMNLVAKEYIAAQDPDDPGVAILSRFAGAAEQLDDALIVNPYNLEEVADAILRAIEMGKTERMARHERLLSKIKTNDAATWTRSFLSTLETVAAKRLPATDVSRFIRELSQPTHAPFVMRRGRNVSSQFLHAARSICRVQKAKAGSYCCRPLHVSSHLSINYQRRQWRR